LDEIIGAVNIKDLFLEVSKSCLQKSPFKLDKLLKKVVFVSPAIRLFDLLQTLQQERTRVALVVDEYGGIDGLVSTNDIIKELINDFDNNTALNTSMKLVHRADGSYLADGRLELKELENKFSSFLTEEEKQEDIDTLGGLVSFLGGHVPPKGEIIAHSSGLEFEVVDADPRRVKMVIIRYINKENLDPEDGPHFSLSK
jgi:CBS domain containing-hemolysin-like protein